MTWEFRRSSSKDEWTLVQKALEAQGVYNALGAIERTLKEIEDKVSKED